MTVHGEDPDGTAIGPVAAGTKIVLQYVSGSWTHQNDAKYPAVSPDDIPATRPYGEQDRLAIFAVDSDSGEPLCLTALPNGTANQPFEHTFAEAHRKVILRMPGGYPQRRAGSVRYRCTVIAGPALPPAVGESTGGKPEPHTFKQLSQPERYADKHDGMTGYRDTDNTYSLDIKRLGRHTTVRLYMYGSGGHDTSGEVLLTRPDGTRTTICEWNPKAMEDRYSTSSTAKNVRPVEIDASQHVTEPGKYEVTFRYKSGRNALRISKVEIVTRN
jgi:hypothetical protein